MWPSGPVGAGTSSVTRIVPGCSRAAAGAVLGDLPPAWAAQRGARSVQATAGGSVSGGWGIGDAGEECRRNLVWWQGRETERWDREFEA